MNSEQEPAFPGSYRRVFVDAQGLLEPALDSISDANALGVDLEMGQRVERKPGGQQEWKHVLALIQIASEDVSLIIDPRRCNDLSPLGPIMAGPIRKVFLGGGQDVALLEQALVPASTIVDVGEVALGIWGRREDGMAALARRIFNLSLDKTVRRADWLARPLNPALLVYAHQDAELTLAIYRWLAEHFPDEVAYHERELLDPPLPHRSPEWLRAAMKRTPGDARVTLAEFGLDVETHRDQVVAAVRALLAAALPPRQLSRLLRIVSDLELRELLPQVLPFAYAPTSVIRAAVARTLGVIGDPEAAEPELLRLQEDQVEEVRRAATGALKEIRRPAPQPEEAEVQDEQSSIGDEARGALAALMEQLSSDRAD